MTPNPDSNGLSSTFWWVRHDYVQYKVPIEDGKTLLSLDYLVPGFVPDTSELSYRFVHGKRDDRKVGDFSCKGDSIFFVNERTYKIFEKMFLSHGRSYEVRCDNKKYYIILIDSIADAIDLNRSRFERSDIEEKLEDDISRFFKVAIKLNFKSSLDIFRLYGSFALNNQLIVSDKFKKIYEIEGLTGLNFVATDGA